jgi:hypothetical protein
MNKNNKIKEEFKNMNYFPSYHTCNKNQPDGQTGVRIRVNASLKPDYKAEYRFRNTGGIYRLSQCSNCHTVFVEPQ